MEKMLEIILKEVQEIRTEVEETKQELRNEMQEMKQELRSEMQEMKQEIYIEKRDNELREAINEAIKVQNNMLKEIKMIKIQQKEFDLRLCKVEFAQEKLEERLLKNS